MAGRHSPTHSHSHTHDLAELDQVPVPALARRILVGVLIVCGLAAAGAMWHWWPDHDKVAQVRGSVPYAAQGVRFESAEIVSLGTRCPPGDYGENCDKFTVMVHGSTHRVQVPPQVAAAGLEPGDLIKVMITPDGTVSFFEIDRGTTLWWLAGLFALVVVAVARWRGLMALVGLSVAGAVAGRFILPALLIGEPPAVIAVVGAVVIMYVVLFSTHGVTLRTSVALAGTLAGVAITAVVASIAVGRSHLTGVSDDVGGLLMSVVDQLSLQDVLIASVIIAGLGALNDVTITQASAVWELRLAAPGMSRLRLWASGMRIGRDHVASTIYTLAFAYMGAAMMLLLAIQLYDRSLFSLISSEDIAEEVVRSLAGGIGVVLAMPITTAIAAVVVAGPRSESGPETQSAVAAGPAGLG